MEPLTEKRYNAAINVWIREPALVVTATLGFVQLHTQNQAQFGWGIGAVRVFLMLLAMWNGLFFMERVVGNYHVCAYKAKQQRQHSAAQCRDELTASPARRSPSKGGFDPTARRHSESAIYDAAYESTEHFTASVLGMRVSVSRNDLDELSKCTDRPPLPMADAYPTAEAKAKKI